MKRIPGDTRGIEAQKMLEWCAKDLKCPKPKLKFFFWHRNKKLHDLESKRGEMTIANEKKIDGYYLVGSNTIYINSALSLKRTLHVIAHEFRHYHTDLQGTDQLMWHGDREQAAESYAQYAMKYFNSPGYQRILKESQERQERKVRQAKVKTQPEKDPEKSERFLMYEYLTNNGYPNRGYY